MDKFIRTRPLVVGGSGGSEPSVMSDLTMAIIFAI